MKNEVIFLITTTETHDSDGFPITSEMYTKCMAEIESVKYSEFYKASELGIKVSCVAKINAIDYDLATIVNEVPFEAIDVATKKPFMAYRKITITPELVDVDGKRYKVSRTYRVKKHNDIELTLSEVE